MINLTGDAKLTAQNFLKALFYRGGITKKYAPFGMDESDAKAICDEIINRQFDFIRKKLDTCLQHMADNKECFISLDNKTYTTAPAETLAKYIAWICKEKNILWDDVGESVTKEELKAYRTTILGKALYDNGCFTSNLQGVDNSKNTEVDASSTSTGSAPVGQETVTAANTVDKAYVDASVQGGAPVKKQPTNRYKSTGAHSDKIPNLIGNPGAKFTFTGKMYCIEADKEAGKSNVPYVFITPLRTDKAGNPVKVSKEQAEKVHFGSGNGYTDCTVWFDNKTDASVYLGSCRAAFNGRFNNIHMAEKDADKNGYFKVSTEFGAAYIKAKPLNEEIIADSKYELDEAADEEVYENSSKGYKISDIDTYDEWMHHSIS